MDGGPFHQGENRPLHIRPSTPLSSNEYVNSVSSDVVVVTPNVIHIHSHGSEGRRRNRVVTVTVTVRSVVTSYIWKLPIRESYQDRHPNGGPFPPGRNRPGFPSIDTPHLKRTWNQGVVGYCRVTLNKNPTYPRGSEGRGRNQITVFDTVTRVPFCV